MSWQYNNNKKNGDLKVVEKDVEALRFTDEDVRNINEIFTYAKKYIVANDRELVSKGLDPDKELLALITYRSMLMNKIRNFYATAKKDVG